MSYICFYPDASDVFDIGLKGGISYFLLLKQQNTKSVVKNIMTSQKYFNGIVERDIRNGATLLNIGNEIVNSLGLYKSYSFSKSMDKRYVVVNSNKIIGAKGCCFLTDGTATVLSASDVRERQVFEKDSELFGTKVDVVFSSDNLEECLSFISWVDSKFV